MVRSISLPSKQHQGGATKRHALIYFVCGNPGLIEFYTVFLECLRGLLDTSESSGSGTTSYDIYGRCLFGFDDDDHVPFAEGGTPFDLNDQVEGIYKDVAAQRVPAGDKTQDQRPYDDVILMGHSVGAYISTEIFHRHMKSQSQAPHLNLRYGFLLFPTLTHIALSPSGKQVTLLNRLPSLATFGHIYAQFILGLFTVTFIQYFITNIMGFTPQTAGVTARWLKSRDGVRQSIHLGLAELREICEDKWEEQLWEISAENEVAGDSSSGDDEKRKGGKAGSPPKTPKFFMFYGNNDHWVANHIRDEFIEKRKEHGLRGGQTMISVDEGNIPHAFCTRESKFIPIRVSFLEGFKLLKDLASANENAWKQVRVL